MAILHIFTDSIGAGTCRSCHAPIVWTELTSGKKHPFNGRPADLVPVKSYGDSVTGREVQDIDTSVNLSHFATCVDAPTWRRKK